MTGAGRSRASACFAALGVVALLAAATDIGALRFAAAVIALSSLPGAAALRLCCPARPLDLALALALSPFLSGALMTALLFVGLPPFAASCACLLACVAALSYDAVRERGGRSRDSGGEGDAAADGTRRMRPADLALIVLLTAVTVFPLVRSDRVRASIHGFLHASILYSITDRGVPPENPFFAGETLRYYWTWHAGQAATCHLAATEPTRVFAASNVVALLAFLSLLHRLGRALSPARGVGLLAVFLGYLGLNPLGALVFSENSQAPWFRGLDALEQGMEPILYLKALAVGSDDRITATLTKFLNVSSFPHALALLVAAFALLVRVGERARAADAIGAGLATAGCIALSPITGLTGGLALGAGSAIAWLLARIRRRREDARAAAMACAALAGGLAVSIPFVLLGGAGSGEGEAVAIDPTLQKLRDAIANTGPILLLAAPALVLSLGRGHPGRRIAAMGAIGVLCLGVLLWFPVNSQYKMTRMAAPILGAFAAASLARWIAPRSLAVRAAASALAVLPFVPTNAMAWRAYLHHSRTPFAYEGNGTSIEVDPRDWPLADAYVWIREHTPADAVILVDPDESERAFAGPFQGEEVPALARRSVFTDRPYYMNDYEPDLPDRYRLARRLFSGAKLADSEVALLRSLGRPLYLLIRGDHAGAARALQGVSADPRWRLAAEPKAAFIYELRRGGRG